MNLIMIKYLVILLLFVSGCLSREAIDQEISKLPIYMQENIGEVKYQPLSFNGISWLGRTTLDMEGTVYLYGLADKQVLRHELFHSFETRMKYTRFDEWERFCTCFGGTKRSFLALALSFWIPTQWLPSTESGSLYGETNHFEDAAEVFRCKKPKRKWECVKKFVTGIFRIPLTTVLIETSKRSRGETLR